MKQVQQGDAFQLQIAVYDSETLAIKDISTASARSVYALSPSGVTLTKTASFVTNGSDGLIYCTFDENDIDVSGLWRVQAELTMTAGPLHTRTIHFEVMDNLA